MQILTDNKNLIIGYAEVGSLEGGIEILNPVLPDTFISEFKSCKFKYEDGVVSYNKDFVDGEANTQLKMENVSLEEKVKILEEEVRQLKELVTQPETEMPTEEDTENTTPSE